MADVGGPITAPSVIPGLPKEQGTKNWAENPLVAARLKKELVPLVDEVKARRSPLNAFWARMFKMWTLEHEEQNYEGRSNLYIPAARKGIETLVAQTVEAAFPSEDTFSVRASQPGLEQAAVLVKEALKVRIDKHAKVRSHAEALFRQLFLTGNSPVKIRYRRDVVRSVSRKRRRGFGITDPEMTERVKYDGPAFEPLDVCNVYSFPENVPPNEAELVFEVLSTSKSALMRKARQGIYTLSEVEKIKPGSASTDPEAEKTRVARLSGDSIPNPSDAPPDWAPVDIIECWFDFDPLAHTRDDEDNPVPFLVTLTADGCILRAIENPFWHKRCPILWARIGSQVGRGFGSGVGDSVHPLQVLLNDQTNQGMDCASYVLNPIVLTNPMNILGPLPELEPGVQFLVRDINAAVKFDRPPESLVQVMSLLSNQTMSWIQDFMGSPPVLQGGSAPGRAFKTATGIGTAQRNATVPLQGIVRLVETDVFEPMLYMFWALDQQFQSPGYLQLVNDGHPINVDPDQLAGDWMFEWLASTQASNQMVKGQQILQALQILTSQAIVQLLSLNGVRVNPAPLARRFYREVLGFRDVDDVLVQDPTAGMQAKLGMVGGESPEATSGEPTPGNTTELEGNPEFEATRGEADPISAMLGEALGG